jgi:hypothetical protein
MIVVAHPERACRRLVIGNDLCMLVAGDCNHFADPIRSCRPLLSDEMILMEMIRLPSRARTKVLAHLRGTDPCARHRALQAYRGTSFLFYAIRSRRIADHGNRRGDGCPSRRLRSPGQKTCGRYGTGRQGDVFAIRCLIFPQKKGLALPPRAWNLAVSQTSPSHRPAVMPS